MGKKLRGLSYSVNINLKTVFPKSVYYITRCVLDEFRNRYIFNRLKKKYKGYNARCLNFLNNQQIILKKT